MAEDNRPRLGRGLAALIGEAGDEASLQDRGRGQRRIPIEFIRPNPRNPRKTFDDAGLDELAESIREKGVLQPIVVRELPGASGIFEIIAGERRWRAAQRASLHNVPVIVVEASDKESLELAIVENVQRSDLNPLEEADGYGQLMREFAYTQADLARIIGKSRSHIANTLRLANLPDSVKALVTEGSLSAGHARALLALEHPEAVARKVVEQGLTVRDVERMAQNGPTLESAPRPGSRQNPEKDPDTRALEKSLQDALGLTVSIVHKKESGEVRIRYRALEQLDQLCQRLLNQDGR